MATTETMTALNTTASCTTPSPTPNEVQYSKVLLSVYSVVLLIGTISLSLMMHNMKSSSTSITSIAVLNLIFAHFVFLFTVPFRIQYYATGEWILTDWWCKVVSAMIHIHMYMSFFFYNIILITRLLTFYHKRKEIISLQRIHNLIVSAVVWIVVLISVPCIISVYGTDNDNNNDTICGTKDNKAICFKFGKHIEHKVMVLNYILSTVIIVGATTLTALQANVLRVLCKKYDGECTSQQEFWAQLKGLLFALNMVVCFIPYHIFRLYYLKHTEELENFNEVFLSLTTFNCLDMLTFLGWRSCYSCFPGNAV